MKEKKSLSIYIFWIIVVFYLDPGGYLNSNLSPSGRTIFSFVSLITVFLIFNFYYRNSKFNILSLEFIKGYILLMLIWMTYYFVIYYGYNNSEGFPGVFNMVLRNPNIFFKSLIVIPIAYFSTFSLNSFFRILIWSTIIIGLFFIVTTFTGINLMDTWRADRNMGSAKRSFMYGYGLINFVIPIAISIWFLKFKMNKKVLFAALMASVIIMITVYRRDMVGVIEYIVIISIIVNYIQKKFFLHSFSKYLNLKNIVIASIVLIMLSVYASNFLNSTTKLVMGTLGSIGLIENTESVSRTDNARMSLTAKVGIIKAIKDNFYTGTGFDPVWMTGDGGDDKWEGSDYIFLAAFAMYGIIGLLLFLPFYIISFNIIRSILKLIRSNNRLIYIYNHHLEIPVIIGIASAAEILKNMIEYPNWFSPIGAIDYSSKYFIFFGLLLGSYYNLQLKFKKLNS